MEVIIVLCHSPASTVSLADTDAQDAVPSSTRSLHRNVCDRTYFIVLPTRANASTLLRRGLRQQLTCHTHHVDKGNLNSFSCRSHERSKTFSAYTGSIERPNPITKHLQRHIIGKSTACQEAGYLATVFQMACRTGNWHSGTNLTRNCTREAVRDQHVLRARIDEEPTFAIMDGLAHGAPFDSKHLATESVNNNHTMSSVHDTEDEGRNLARNQQQWRARKHTTPKRKHHQSRVSQKLSIIDHRH